MNVLFAASEITPIVKSGGLADVIGALPVALKEQGVDVRIVIPAYPDVLGDLPRLQPIERHTFSAGSSSIKVSVYQTSLEQTGIPVYLLHTSQGLTSPELYSLDAEVEQDRFVLFSLAVLEWLKFSSWQPEIIHGHDWMTGMLMKLVKDRQLPYKTILTIHNLKYQGSIPLRWVSDLGLDCPESKGYVNLLALGLDSADKITTVSPTYAAEILTTEYGYGLEKILESRQYDLVGIINGLDQRRFSPQHNPFVNPSYTIDSVITGKAQHKQRLQHQCNLPQDDRIPLYGVVGRASRQKGMDLLAEVLNRTDFLKQAQLVILTGRGTTVVEELLENLAALHPESIRLHLGFDDAFSHQIYAACDFFVMPSKYEPCGLTQLIAMKYGTVPIVRKTGGLADTVIDIENQEKGVGIVFKDYNQSNLSTALDRSLALFECKQQLNQAVRRAMQQDFSWNEPVKAYVALYQLILKSKVAR